MTEDSNDPENIEGKTLRSLRIRRLLYLAYGVFFINYAFVIWALVGYVNLVALSLIWSLLIISFFFILYSVYEGPDRVYFRYLSYAAFTISFALYLVTTIAYAPMYGTDEIAIDSYSAYLVLHGLNPYINANMTNVFAVTGFPSSLITPLLTGGAVKFLVYPALSVFLFVPAILLNIPSYSMLLLFNAIAFVIAYVYYQRSNFSFALPALAVAMLLDLEYATFSVGGVTDIVWVTFVSAAYILRKKPLYSGLFFGLAIAFKQTPLVMLPFFLFFLYNENGLKLSSLGKFILTGVTVFLAINLPFIIMNPLAWATNVTEIAVQPIIGVGIGPSITSFAGFVQIPSIVFTIISISLLAVFFVLYVTGYRRFRYAFFTFPIVVFLFNFRVLENYLIFWPFFFFIVLPDLNKPYVQRQPDQRTKTGGFFLKLTGGRKVTAALLAILITGTAAASVTYVVTSHTAPTSPFVIANVSGAGNPYMVPGEITMLTLSLNYSPQEGFQYNQTVLYRIFPDYSLNNVNSLLWSETTAVKPGMNNVTIFPDTSSDFLKQNTSFRLEAYYGNYSTFFSVDQPPDVNDSVPFSDPFLLYPTYVKADPYPGWYTTLSGDGNFSYHYLPGGVNFSLHTLKTPGFLYMTSVLNFSEVIANNDTFSYAFRGTGNNSQGSYVFQNGSNFTIARFDGMVLSFNGGSEQFWLGYSSNTSNDGLFQYNRSTILDIVPTTIISFKTILNEIKAYSWSYGEPMISFVVGSDLSHSNLTAVFFNTTLDGADLPVLPSYQYSAQYNPAVSFAEEGKW